MAFAVLLLLLAAYSNAAPAIHHMTSCERMLYSQCIVNIGSSKQFRDLCKEEKLVTCMQGSFQQNICTEDDRETIPTIKRLIGITKRKFRNDPDFCKSDKKFHNFIAKLESTITVQGEGIEFTEPRHYESNYESSGSGDSTVPDDTENDDDDENEDNENDNAVQNTDQHTNEQKKTNTVRKDSKFWIDQSKLILKGKNDRKVQMLVYFDDHQRNKSKKTLSDAETKRLQREWDALKRRYQRWYEASKYNRVKR